MHIETTTKVRHRKKAGKNIRRLMNTVIILYFICIIFLMVLLCIDVYYIIHYYTACEIGKTILTSLLFPIQLYNIINLFSFFRILRKRKKILNQLNEDTFWIFSKN